MTFLEENMNTVIQGDCLEVMKSFPDKSIDIVVTSPPYNTGNKSLGYHPNSKTGDNINKNKDVDSSRLYKIAKNKIVKGKK